ncbi:hypothetical protein IWQ61_003513 [Dispira simplex]|nr:hypothetical protein IWQ61_003513 [Dispira simplex]
MRNTLDWTLLALEGKSGEFPSSLLNTTEATLCQWVSKGEYQTALLSAQAQDILGPDQATSVDTTTSTPQTSSLSAFYREYLGKRLIQTTDAIERRALQYRILAVGVAFMQLFIQQGWTGPKLDGLSLATYLPDWLYQREESDKAWHQHALKCLEIDGESPYHLATDPYLLVLARILLVDVLCPTQHGALDVAELKAQRNTVPPSLYWWAMRCLRVHQNLLDERSATLYEHIGVLGEATHSTLEQLATETDPVWGILSENSSTELWARFYLERGLACQSYDKNEQATSYFGEAQQASGLKWTVTGAPGRRTKFQQFDVSQLVVLAESTSLQGEVDAKKTPRDIKLDDDTLLETTRFTQSSDQSEPAVGPHTQGNLRIIDQCLLLAYCLNVKNTNPNDGLTLEQMKPYVARVLAHPNNWMVHTMGLLLRSRLESESSRTVERGTLQLQAVVDQMPSEESSVTERLAYFYTLQLPSRWEMEQELARRFMSLGVFRSALDICERLQLWDDVITCYQLLEKEDVAERIVREQLVLHPDSPKLHCILGDILSQPEHWEKAWEVSGDRYARAMRSLGSYYFRNDDYPRCIECYNRALKLNPLFENTWFLLGCAGMRVEDWNIAIQGFLRTVSLDPDNGEAWNNLASCYLRQDKPADAFNTYKQAVRKNFENWRIWSNYLYVAIDIGQFGEAISALMHIVNLRYPKVQDKCLDVDLLQLLVQAAIRDLPDIYGVSAAKQSRMLETLLVETITSRITTNPRVWKICADFWFWKQEFAKALEAHFKAYRCLITNPTLDYSEETFTQVAEGALDLIDMLRNLGPKPASPETPDKAVAADWNYQARLVLRSLVARTKDTFDAHPQYQRLVEALAELKEEKKNSR